MLIIFLFYYHIKLEINLFLTIHLMPHVIGINVGNFHIALYMLDIKYPLYILISCINPFFQE